MPPSNCVHHEGVKGVVRIVASNGNLRTASNLHLIGKGHINVVHLHLLYVTLGIFVAPIEAYRIFYIGRPFGSDVHFHTFGDVEAARKRKAQAHPTSKHP